MWGILRRVLPPVALAAIFSARYAASEGPTTPSPDGEPGPDGRRISDNVMEYRELRD